MTILGFEEISCACCGKPFEISFLYSTNNLGQRVPIFTGARSDFNLCIPKRKPVPHADSPDLEMSLKTQSLMNT